VDAEAEGAFRILATGHPTGIFDCRGVSADSVVRGVDDYFATLWAVDGDAHLMDGQWWPVWLEACRANVPIIIDPDNELLFEYAPGYTEEDNEWYDCRMKLYYFWRPAIGGGPDLPPRVPLPPDGYGGPGSPGAPTPVDTTTQQSTPTLDSLSITPSSLTVPINGVSQNFLVIGYYSDDSVRSVTSVTGWSVSSPAIARTGDDAGHFVGVTPGTTTVSFTANNKSVSATLVVSQECSVTDDPPRPAFDNEPAVNAWLLAKCLQPMGARLDTLRTIRAAASSFLRPSSSFASAEGAAQCAAALSAVDSLFRDGGGEGSIHMGRDSVVGAGVLPHNGEGYAGSGQMHFEPTFWRDNVGTANGRKEIFRTLLHEAVHAVLGDRNNAAIAGHGPPNTQPNYALYDYFKFIDLPGPNSCII